MNRFQSINWITLCLLLGSFATIALLVGCTAKYVQIEDPSKKIELSCYSIKPPWEGKWYKVGWSSLGIACKERAKLVSGGGEDIYILDFFSRLEDWKDDFSNEFLLDKGETYIKSQEKILRKNKEYQIEDINLDVEVAHGVKDICTKLKTEYTFSTSKPFYYKTHGQTGEEIEFGLNPSDKYFLESIEFSVIDGPYKMLIGRNALVYRFILTHISVDENGDPELEARALNFLKNLEVTVDWNKVEVE